MAQQPAPSLYLSVSILSHLSREVSCSWQGLGQWTGLLTPAYSEALDP